MKTIKNFMIISLAFVCISSAQASVHKLPGKNDDLIGKVQTIVTAKGDTFSKIAEKFDIGYYEMVQANPFVNPDKPQPGTVVIVPSQYILPSVAREGIIINLAEMRLYYYPKHKNEVWTFPVGIGRKGSQTPLGDMSIIEHMDHPTWHSPESIRVERAKEGIIIPKVVPPGPENPLGEYAMRLSMRTYLIHGTNDNSGVGRRSSSGCIRMFPQDIEKLFHSVEDGDKVVVISEPYKLGRHQGYVYLESYLALQENADRLSSLSNRINQYVQAQGGYAEAPKDLNSQIKVATGQQGMPQRISALLITS
ncbi:MAG: L,D-transpeptidase family protein [Pseudomonadota bacterium]|nr:L,D-transpeptidase family protein [Pseudomonadota bacterium]